MRTVCLAWILIFLLSPLSLGQEISLAKLFNDGFTFFQLLRQENGIYRDALRFDGEHIHPASISVTGMGLVTLCIADRMEWISNAEERALTTLETVTGKNPSFLPDRNQTGYFRHWLDLRDGSRAWESEYSTIDTAILVAAANFCRNYFSSKRVDSLVEELFLSIDWSESIADASTGGLFREMKANGEGKAGTVSTPFSEYMLVAWLAWQEEQRKNETGPATALWQNTYADASQLKTKEYQGIPLLTDRDQGFLSHFTLQFCYFLCHEFTHSAAYRHWMERAAEADRLWWAQSLPQEPFAWGLGAGSVGYGYGYHADAIGNNKDRYISPHIIAGFLPVHKKGKQDLTLLLEQGNCLYKLPHTDSAFVLWRKSMEHPNWTAPDIQGIDYASMVLGLAVLPEFAGEDFYAKYNAIPSQGKVNDWHKGTPR